MCGLVELMDNKETEQPMKYRAMKLSDPARECLLT